MAESNNFSNMNRLFSTAGTGQTRQGTGYTNLNRLTQANANNKLGEKVAGDVSKQITGVQSQLGQQQQKFNEESESNKLDTDANKNQRDATIGRFSSASGSAPAEGPNKQELDSFGRFRSGQYTGPSGLQDTSSLSSTASGLNSQLSDYSPSGTQELLKRSVGGNRYSQGQQRLDSLLMDKSKITPLQRQGQSLGQDINRANIAATGTAQLYKNQAQQFGNETNDKLNTALTGLDTVAQGQFKSAQDTENARKTQLQQLTNTLQGDMIAKLDANGKQVLDDNGAPVMERKLSGATDPYARFDQISGLLKNQGFVNENQHEALFGKGSVIDHKNKYDTNLADIRKNEVLGLISGTGQAINPYQPYGIGANLYKVKDLLGGGNGAMKSKIDNYINSNKLDTNANSYNTAMSELFKQGQISEADINSLEGYYSGQGVEDQGQSFDRGTSGVKLLDTINVAGNDVISKRAKELESFKTNTGLAGRSTLDSKQDDFYNNLSRSLESNTQQATGLTKAGTASDEVRGNYNALEKLLGKGADTSQFRQNDERYKAGKINLDAAQLRRSLGY